MRDELISEKARVTFTCCFTCITKICSKYLQQNWYISNSCFSRCKYVPETLMQKNNRGIIDNDMRIKQEESVNIFGKCWKE